jgi:hypothetical protein
VVFSGGWCVVWFIFFGWVGVVMICRGFFCFFVFGCCCVLGMGGLGLFVFLVFFFGLGFCLFFVFMCVCVFVCFFLSVLLGLLVFCYFGLMFYRGIGVFKFDVVFGVG